MNDTSLTHAAETGKTYAQCSRNACNSSTETRFFVRKRRKNRLKKLTHGFRDLIDWAILTVYTNKQQRFRLEMVLSLCLPQTDVISKRLNLVIDTCLDAAYPVRHLWRFGYFQKYALVHASETFPKLWTNFLQGLAPNLATEWELRCQRRRGGRVRGGGVPLRSMKGAHRVWGGGCAPSPARKFLII